MMGPYDLEAERLDHQRALGQRLRHIRRQQGMSLAEVERRSGGEWKAVVVGAYERGDRAVSLERLERLASFYGVPLTELMTLHRRHSATAESIRMVIDLTRLEQSQGPGIAVVARYAERIRRLRGDHNAHVLTVRGADLDTLASAIGSSPRELLEELRDHGVLLDLT